MATKASERPFSDGDVVKCLRETTSRGSGVLLSCDIDVCYEVDDCIHDKFDGWFVVIDGQTFLACDFESVPVASIDSLTDTEKQLRAAAIRWVSALVCDPKLVSLSDRIIAASLEETAAKYWPAEDV